jgi:hypothetical protein
MNRVPGIKGSAQARLILYRLFSLKLSDAERELLSADPSLWEKILLLLEENIALESQERLNRTALEQAFSHIERTTKEGLQKQIERLAGNSLWLGTYPSDYNGP